MLDQHASASAGNGSNVAIVYARVSSRTQFVKGYSLEQQVDCCVRFAKDLGFAADDILVLKGYESGMHLNRVELSILRDKVKQGFSKTVIVANLDRLTRNLSDLLLLRQEFQQAEVTLWFAGTKKKAAQLPDEHMLENIEVIMLQKEHGHLTRRVRAARTQKITRLGGMIANFQAPYGLRVIGEGLSLSLAPADDYTADVVRKMYEWRGDDRLGVVNIARRLTSQGTPTPSQHSGRKAPKGKHQSNAWNHNTILGILRNPVYKGVFYHNRFYLDENGKQKMRPSEEWVAVPVTPLVSEDEWQAAQGSLSRNLSRRSKQNQRQYLLSGLCRCGFCGRALAARTVPGKTYTRKDGSIRSDKDLSHYFCTSITSGKPCSLPPVPRHLLEDTLWSWLVNTISIMSDAQIGTLFGSSPVTSTSSLQELQSHLDILTAHQQRLNSDYKRLLLAELNNTYPTSIIDQTKAEYALMQSEITKGQERIEELIRGYEALPSSAAFSHNSFSDAEISFDHKRQVVHTLGITLVISPLAEPQHNQDCNWAINVSSLLGQTSLSMVSRVMFHRRWQE